jgi:hypothetical protein
MSSIMRNRRTLSHVLHLGFFLAAFACVPSLRSDSVKDVRSQDKSASSDDAEEAAQSESVSPPVPITGSYLHCEINDKDVVAANRGEVGCRIDDGTTRQKVNLPEIYKVANFLYQRPSDPNVTVSGSVADPDSPFHVVYNFQGGTEPLSLDTLRNFLVMFRANPITAQPNEFIFSARLGNATPSLLPENFPVYYGEGTIINNPAPGFEQRILPTVNHTYPSIDGCYIACYSNSSTNAVYEIGPGIFVMGQFRVKGIYAGRLCQADGYQNAPDLAKIPEFIAACGKHLPACAGDICWGGNDTGGWFGFQ